MKTFEANRLSDGNKIFPAKISIDEFGVTLKIPGFLGGKEKTLSYLDISSVNIDTPMVGYSKITFRTIGFDQIYATGFSKADAIEIKQMVQQYAATARTGGFNSAGLGGGGNASEAEHLKEKVIAEKEIALKKMELDEEFRKENEIKKATSKKEKEAKIEKYKSENKRFLAILHANRGLIICLFFFILPLIFGIIGNRIVHGTFIYFFITPMIIFGILYILDFIKK
jgi:hypothetical protein